jgi:hypothetical protein
MGDDDGKLELILRRHAFFRAIGHERIRSPVDNHGRSNGRSVGWRPSGDKRVGSGLGKSRLPPRRLL